METEENGVEEETAVGNEDEQMIYHMNSEALAGGVFGGVGADFWR